MVRVVLIGEKESDANSNQLVRSITSDHETVYIKEMIHSQLFTYSTRAFQLLKIILLINYKNFYKEGS